MIDLRCGDCLEVMKGIPDGSVDMVLADPPYGITACKWDSVIPLNRHIMVKKGKKMVPVYEDEWILTQAYKSDDSVLCLRDQFLRESSLGLWDHLKRITKPNGAIVMTASQPFTSALIGSNKTMFKYCWVWRKERGTGFQVAKYRPMMETEDCVVFCNRGGKIDVYKPQMTKLDKPKIEKFAGTKSGSSPLEHLHEGTRLATHRYPKNIIEISRDASRIHPTQKPVALMEYMIRTYTNEGETVLDFCMGSFSTAIACLNTKRSFIGIEKDAHYFQVGKDRVEKHLITLDYTPEIVYYQV